MPLPLCLVRVSKLSKLVFVLLLLLLPCFFLLLLSALLFTYNLFFCFFFRSTLLSNFVFNAIIVSFNDCCSIWKQIYIDFFFCFCFFFPSLFKDYLSLLGTIQISNLHYFQVSYVAAEHALDQFKIDFV